ncbi:MAG: SGNH/GDSL hydrolase family protein [Chloroflexota bacterium]
MNGQPTPSPDAAAGIRYVALGDSYTIGTSTDVQDRFPNQLVLRLKGKVELELVANLGVNGYSTYDLINDELPDLAPQSPDFVTVLIGVNDVVQGISASSYSANVVLILDDLLDRLPANRIVVVSVPDYTRTPYGSAFGDPAQQRAEIANFNSIMREAAERREIAFVDISSVADRVGTETGLLADDGLHPSGKQYGLWVDLIAPVVEESFAR